MLILKTSNLPLLSPLEEPELFKLEAPDEISICSFSVCAAMYTSITAFSALCSLNLSNSHGRLLCNGLKHQVKQKLHLLKMMNNYTFYLINTQDTFNCLDVQDPKRERNRKLLGHSGNMKHMGGLYLFSVLQSTHAQVCCKFTHRCVHDVPKDPCILSLRLGC